MGIIGSIRKHSWIAVTIVGIAIIAFIIGDLTKRRSAGDIDVAEINGETLNSIQFNNLVQQEENKIKMFISRNTGDPNPTLTSKEEKRLRDSLWANYVDEAIIGEQLNKLGLEVSEAELNDMFTGTFIHPMLVYNPSLQDENGQYSRAKASNMVKVYTNTNDQVQRLNWEETKKMMSNDRLRQKYVTLLTSGFYMPKPIAKQMASYTTQGSSVAVVRIPYDKVADSEVQLTNDDYKKYYEKHKEEYRNLNEERRLLEYVAFDIAPSTRDREVAADSVNAIWTRLQATPDSMTRALGNLIRLESKDVEKYKYDSTYNRYLPASYFAEPFNKMIEASQVGTEIAPVMIDDNKWFMGRVMNIENRPDSIRTSVMFVMTNKQRDSVSTALFADSLLTELNAGRLTFDTAVEKYCDVKFSMSQTDTLGDMKWQKEGNIDNYYNQIFNQVFRVQGLSLFNGLNEEIVKLSAGEQIRFALPQNVGYAIVKVTGKTEPIKKYRLAMIVKKVQASKETENDIQNKAYEFLTSCNNGKDFDKAVQERKMQPRTAIVYRTDDRQFLGQVRRENGDMNVYLNNLRDVVKWAFNNGTKIGDVTIDAKLDRGEEPVAGINKKEKKDDVMDVVAVVRLKEVYQSGYLTLDQVLSIPEFNFKQRVLMEKKSELQMAYAEKLAKSCKNIQDVAASLNDTAVVIDSVNLHFGADMMGLFGPQRESFGGFGLEPKVRAAVAASKTDGLIGPIKGAQGIFFVQVSNRYEKAQQIEPEQICMGIESNVRYSYGMTNAEYLHQNDEFYAANMSARDGFFADWNIRRYMPSIMLFNPQYQRWIPFTRECRLTQWLRANAKVDDHREQIY